MTDVCPSCDKLSPPEMWSCQGCTLLCCGRCATGFLCPTCAADPELLLLNTARQAIARYITRDSGDPDIELAREALETLARRWGE